ncbi:MAG TPA: DM13 domain-containing protein [Aggregatilineales bacterium]|nr:DM13 domain-containing protein [Aggregatilineales bacterium]
MNNRIRLFLILIGAAAVAAVFTFPLWRPLLVDDTVNEVFPGLTGEQQTAFINLPAEQQAAMQATLQANPTQAVEMARAITSGDQIVSAAEQEMPQMSDPRVIGQGNFNQIDIIHGGTGTAMLYELPDGSRVLRFENFRVTNGPELHVILTRNDNPLTPEDVGTDYIDLGPLKGNVGNQNYNVPSEIDFSQYQAVVIYCLPFRVVFSVATLF